MDEPQYKHDCIRCTFLGKCTHEGKTADLYYCSESGPLKYGSVVARLSSEPVDYLSASASGKVMMSPMVKEAYDRAVKMGLAKP